MRRILLPIILSALLLASCNTTRGRDEVYMSTYEDLTFLIRCQGEEYTLSIPEQLAYFIPLERYPDGSLRIPELDIAIRGTFPGRCNYTQYGVTVKLDFALASSDGEAFFKRPQEEVPRYREEHRVDLPDGGYLGGEIIKAGEERSENVILFISGSGTQDRYETIANHRPFLVIANALASSGYDSFLFDDRGCGKSSEAIREGDITLLAEEAVAVYDYLESLGYGKIVLLGHSQGGNIAAMASSERDVAALILLSTPALSGLALQLEESRQSFERLGYTESEITNLLLMIFSFMKNLMEGRVEEAQEILIPFLGEEEAKAETERLLNDAYLATLSYDPIIHLARLTCPTLAILGTQDRDAPIEVNSPVLLEALQHSAARFVFSELDGVNHMLQSGGSGAIEEYGVVEETVAPEVLDTIIGFLKEEI